MGSFKSANFKIDLNLAANTATRPPNSALRLFTPQPDNDKDTRRIDLHEVLVVLSNSTLLFFISRRFHLASVAL